MRHLSNAEMMVLVEDTAALPEPRAAHLASCARCRGEAESLRAVVSALRADEAPEPSPLFWDRFSARVRAQVDSAPAGPAGARSRSFLLGWLPAAAAMLALVALVASGLRLIPGRGTVTRSSEGPAAAAPASAEVTDVPVTGSAGEEDQPWTLIEVLAADLDWDHLADAGILIEPGTVDMATDTLTEAELGELVRLIKADLESPGS